jgi:hypothetical protein
LSPEKQCTGTFGDRAVAAWARSSAIVAAAMPDRVAMSRSLSPVCTWYVPTVVPAGTRPATSSAATPTDPGSVAKKPASVANVSAEPVV